MYDAALGTYTEAVAKAAELWTQAEELGEEEVAAEEAYAAVKKAAGAEREPQREQDDKKPVAKKEARKASEKGAKKAVLPKTGDASVQVTAVVAGLGAAAIAAGEARRRRGAHFA